MAQRVEGDQIINTSFSDVNESKEEKRPTWRHRSKSIDNVRQQMIRTYISDTGSPRTDFPDPKVSHVALWLRTCLRKLGQGSLDYSLLIFHKNNKFRQKVKRAVKSKLFSIIFGVLVLLNAVLLCVNVPTEWGDYKHRNLIVTYVSSLFLVAYIVEAGMRIIAYGLIFHPKAYVRSADNILDLFTILFGFLNLTLTVAGFYVLADIFGALMAIKLIRVLSVFKRVRFILRALAKSMVPLVFVSIMTLCVMVFFTFLGMELFQGCGLHGGCFANYTDQNGVSQLVSRSEFPCSRGGAVLGDHSCPEDSQCLYWAEGPNYGFTSFDDFRKGLLTVFQLTTLEGWSEVFYLYESACGVTLTWPYFITAIILGSVLFLNLWLGVLTSVFIGVSERQETETNIRQLKEKKRNEKDLENYHKWIQKALDMDLPSESGSIGRRPSLLPAPLWPRDVSGYDSDDEQYRGAQLDLQRRASSGDPLRQELGKKYKLWVWFGSWWTRSRTIALRVVKSRPHFFVKLLVLAVNLVLLMSLHYPLNHTFDNTVFILNYIFSCLFILESQLSLFALGPQRYFSSQFHRFDIVLNSLNILDLILIPVLGRYHFSAIINACRSIKLIKIFKYTRYWVSIKQIIHTITQLLRLTASLMALVVLFLFMYTIIGYRVFGLRLDVDHTVGLPNFNNLLASFLLVFQLMTTEDWHNVNHESGRSWQRFPLGKFLTPIYFTSAIVIGGFILLSIFLSIAVDKLSEVRSVEQEEGREVEKKDKERKDKKRYINALRHPEEGGRYRKTIRGAKHLYEGVRSDRPQKDWEKQLSRHTPVGRLVSTKSMGSGAGGGIGTRTPVEMTPKRELRQSNPLRFIMNPISEAIAEREERLAARLTLTERVRSSFEELDVEEGASHHGRPVAGPDSGDVPRSSRDVRRKVSSMSTPEILESVSSPPANYERTQSLPVSPPSLTAQLSEVYEGDKTVPKLETIDEDGRQDTEVAVADKSGVSDGVGETEQRTEGASRPCPISPNEPPPSPTGRDVTLRRTHGQSSLENVVMRRSQLEEEKSTDEFRRKLQRMWNWFTDYIGTIQFDPKTELAEIPNHSAFFILSPDNSFRVFCYKLVCSKAFNVITYVTIFLSSILLTLEIPITTSLGEDSLLCLLQDVIFFVDLVIIIYFLVEMFLKMTALGIILHRGSYLRGFFNSVDFVITMTTFVPIISYLYNLSKHGERKQPCLAYSYQERLVPVYLATLRVFRVLRPMRAIRISPFYVVVTGLLSSIRSIVRSLFIHVLVMSIFAVIGTIIFRGAFFYCTDPSKMTERECKGYFFTYPTGDLSCPQLNERLWLRHGLNFDNFGQSFLTLFAMITSEGWQEVMYNAYNARLFQDSNDPVGPRPNTSPYSFIFFFLFMCITTLVLLNMFIGFVIVTFQEVGIKAFRESKLDRNQRNCLYYALTTKPLFRYMPKFRWQERIMELTTHSLFSAVIIISLICNSIVLGLQSIQSARVTIYWINFFFTVLFSVEAVLKIIAQHPVNYFKKIWNFVEFLSTTGAILEFILQQTVISDSSDFRYSHFASSFRVLWLLRFVPQVRLIMWTVIKSLEIFPWVGLLLLVVVFSFAVVGMQVFGTIERARIEASLEVPGRHITQYNNFANFPQALLVMIRVTTGENWPDVMLSCKTHSPCEDPALHENCGNNVTYFFYPFFYAIASILFLNLFVAIIIDNFDYLVRDKSILGAHQLSVFVKLWSIYDPSASGELHPDEVIKLLKHGELHPDEVIKLLKQCNPPVGWGTLCPRVITYRNMMNLNMPLVGDKVTFNATLFGLVTTSLGIGCPGCPDCLHVCNHCNAQLKEKLRILFPTVEQKILDEVLPVEDVPTVRPGYAVHLIQTRWRAFVRKRNETIQLFQGKERRSLIAGRRRLPDAGPELVERKLSDFELEDPLTLDLRSPPQGSRKSSVSAVRTLTPASLSGLRFSFDAPVEKSSNTWRDTGLVSSPPLEEPFPVLEGQQNEQDQLFLGQDLSFGQQIKQHPSMGQHDIQDPFMGQQEDDVHSELSFSSAFGTPSDNRYLHSCDHHRETTV